MLNIHQINVKGRMSKRGYRFDINFLVDYGMCLRANASTNATHKHTVANT